MQNQNRIPDRHPFVQSLQVVLKQHMRQVHQSSCGEIASFGFGFELSEQLVAFLQLI